MQNNRLPRSKREKKEQIEELEAPEQTEEEKVIKSPTSSNEVDQELEEVKVFVPAKKSKKISIPIKKVQAKVQKSIIQKPLPKYALNKIVNAPPPLNEIIPTKSNKPQPYLDEQPLIIKPIAAEKTTTGNSPSMTVSIKPAMNHLVLSSSLSQEIPCSIELRGSEEDSCPRSGIDVICVIDVSGSMSGEKLELVKKTLLFMVSRLDVIDRVSLITFSDDAKVKSNLICADRDGKVTLSALIKKMGTEGGTEIIAGLARSLQLLSSRTYINQVTSVILLTDGIDNNKDTAMPRLEKVLADYDKKIASSYTIHTFGYGNDHEADLMNMMAQRKNGGFYFVEKEASIPQLFSDCLGELMSVVADSIFIEISTLPGSIPYSLNKVYSESGDNSFRMPAVLSGDKKEAIFLLSFHPTTESVPNGHKEYPIKAKVSYVLSSTGEKLTQEVTLEVSVLNENDASVEIELDEDVMVNFYRSKAAEILREAAAFGDKRDMASARNLVNAGAQELRECVVASHPTVIKLIQDLESSVIRFRDILSYEHGGKADLKSKANNHFNKRCMYKNKKQVALLEEAEEEI